MSDTNFTSVPALSPGSTSAIYKNILGITAVHHGSKNHHASESFPSPQKKTSTGTIMPATGRIAYSYGMYNSGLSSGAPGSSFTWKHPYRFPAPTAITNYQNGSWPGTGAKITTTTQQSTAEGMNLNNTPAPAIATALPPNRGNIRIGDQTALGTSFNTSAFFKIKHSLT